LEQDLVAASGQGFRRRRKSKQQRGVQFLTLVKIVRSCENCYGTISSYLKIQEPSDVNSLLTVSVVLNKILSYNRKDGY